MIFLPPSARHRGRLQAILAAAAVLALTTCLSEPTVPTGSGAGMVAIRPAFSTSVNLGALSLPIDALHLVLVRDPSDTVADTLVTFSVDDDTLRLSLIVPLRQSPETLQATLELLSGVLPLFLGTSRVEVRRGANSGAAIVPVAFVGPGANIASLLISPRDTFLLLGGALQLQLDARDGQGLPVAQFYVRWSTAAGPLVNAAGVLHAPNLRGNTLLRAELPNGVRDSTRMWFVPLPTVLELLSGSGQSGPIGTLLASPLTVRVAGQDGLGVGGVPVRFRGITGGGFPADTQVVTDTLGIARVDATLGTLIGTQTFEASAPGLTPVLFNLTGTVGAAASIVANSVITQAATVLAAVAAPPSVLVRDAQNNPVPGVTVTFAVIAGGGTILPASTVVTNGSGVATLTSWVLGAVAGTGNNVVEAAVTGLTGSPVRFTASGLVGAASQLALITQPASIGGIGVPLSQQAVVQLRDAGGNDVAQAGVTVTASIGAFPGGSVTIINPSAVTAANGRATFTALTIVGLVGNYSVIFNAPAVTGVTSSLFALAVGPVSAAQSQVAAAPASIVADSASPATVTVTARDIGGNPVAGATVVIAVSGTGNTIAQPTLPTSAGGVATGSFVTIDLGSKTVSASAAGTAITQTVPITATIPPRVVFGGDSLGTFAGIFKVNNNGTVRRSLSTLGNDVANPRLSPDGTRVVFSAAPVGSFTPGVQVAAADGSGFVTVVSDTFSSFPRYNQIGTHLAFKCGSPGFVNTDVCVVPNVNVALASLVNKGNGAGKIILTQVLRPRSGGPSAFAWNPTNANQIATIRDTVVGSQTVLRLFISNFDGSGSVFANGVPLILGADSSIVVEEMSWSPNGQFLVLAAEVSFQRRLYFINANGTGLRQMTIPPFTPQELEDAHPEISPDNTQVLFLRNRLDFEGSDWNYFVMPVSGSEGSQQQVSLELPSGQSSQSTTADWSPDGTQFVLAGTDAVTGTLGVYIMPSSTRSLTYTVNRVRISGSATRSDGAPSMRP